MYWPSTIWLCQLAAELRLELRAVADAKAARSETTTMYAPGAMATVVGEGERKPPLSCSPASGSVVAADILDLDELEVLVAVDARCSRRRSRPASPARGRTSAR